MPYFCQHFCVSEYFCHHSFRTYAGGSAFSKALRLFVQLVCQGDTKGMSLSNSFVYKQLWTLRPTSASAQSLHFCRNSHIKIHLCNFACFDKGALVTVIRQSRLLRRERPSRIDGQPGK
jgi:hypothetical protein